MKIIGLSDIHGNTKLIEQLGDELGKADLVLLAGDITSFGHKQEAHAVVSLIMGFNERVWAVPGNCDHHSVEQHLHAMNINLHCTHKVLQNIAFMGMGGSLPCPGNTPNEFSEKDFTLLLDASAENLPMHLPLVLVTHQPPYGTKNDMLNSGRHVGSVAIRRFIAAYQPLFCLTAHIHESIGIDTIGKTTLANPGPLSKRQYIWAEIDQINVHAEIKTF